MIEFGKLNLKNKIRAFVALSYLSFFFLDEKKTKNLDLGFSAIKIGSLPKTQKLARSSNRGLKQFEFLYGSFTFLILACQILWSRHNFLLQYLFSVYFILSTLRLLTLRLNKKKAPHCWRALFLN